jgi:hypothetical protein
MRILELKRDEQDRRVINEFGTGCGPKTSVCEHGDDCCWDSERTGNFLSSWAIICLSRSQSKRHRLTKSWITVQI